MVSIQDIAKEAKAADELIGTVSHILDRASRSAIIEVTNATTRTLRMVRHEHEHGGFANNALPGPTIAPMSTAVLGSRSAGIMTGTEGRIWYAVDDEGTVFYMHWDVPFAGGNDKHYHVEGGGAGWYDTWGIISNGDKKVSTKFIITEKAMLSPMDSDWITCGECKGLVFRLDGGKCPGRHEWQQEPVVVGIGGETVGGRGRYLPHQGAGWHLSLHYNAPGPNWEGGWRRCKRCKQLFWDGDDRGVCPKWEAPRQGHVAEEGGHEYFIKYDSALRQSQQNDWRFCDKCYVLFFLPHNVDGDCAAGGRHHAHDFNYNLDIVPGT